ncbi:MAG: hypothetical protein JJE04_02805 [Acidobacteriia bacterium]|nr:hypothetical protein [Terriglobia bacterium]
MQVKALACELPAAHGIPLSHWSTPDIARQVCHAGLVATISGSIIWRKGELLKNDEFVISADKKTSIQARRWKHPTLPAAPKLPMRVEHEYQRCGAWAYIAALDVHHARVFGRCETTTGIAPFDRLVE